MKNLITTLGLLASTAIAQGAMASNTLDANAIAAALKPVLADEITVDHRDNLFMQAADNGQDDKGMDYGMEDCRKVALRQTLIDVTSKGETLIGFSRKYSHKMTQVEEAAGPEFGRAYVAARVSKGGQTVERTYKYLLDDPSNSQCYIERKEGVEEGVTKRRDLEKWVADLITKDKFHVSQYGKACVEKVCPDANEYAAAEVGKLIEWECEQASLNKAIELSQKYYVSKYGTNPVMVLDYRRSVTEIKGAYREFKGMKGQWTIQMIDRQGKNLETTSVGFDLVEKPETDGQPGSCEGKIDTEVTVVN